VFVPSSARLVARLALGAMACGCDVAPAGRQVPPRRDTTAVPPAAADRTACPGREFGVFLAAFAEDPALQHRFTQYPLAYVTVDDGPDEPTPVERWLPADSVTEPLFLSAADRVRDTLEMQIDSGDAGRRIVVLAKPDTDYQMTYTFARRADGCWQLTRYHDQSL
jgi:hypothetical protein